MSGRDPLDSPIAPHLTVSNAAAAIAFYQKAFGAEIVSRQTIPDGRTLHCALALNGGVIHLSDEFPELTGGKRRTPDALGGTSVTIHLKVADADAAFNRAVMAGATVTMPLADVFWGARYGRLEDPFGHAWSIAQHKRTPTESDLRQAVDRFLATGKS